jgi:hypothetical protein
MDNITFPWDVDESSPAFFNLSSTVAMLGLPESVWRRPSSKIAVDQIESLMKFLTGPRSWVLCFCSSPSYLRELYIWLSAAWVCTTGSRVCIADVDYLIDAILHSEEKRDTIEHSDLLILPYIDPSHSFLPRLKGAIASILQRRKIRRLPTITDLFIKNSAQLEKTFLEESERLSDVFGDIVSELFSGTNAKYISVSLS